LVCVLCQIHFTKGEALFSMFAFSRLYPHANFTLTTSGRNGRRPQPFPKMESFPLAKSDGVHQVQVSVMGEHIDPGIDSGAWSIGTRVERKGFRTHAPPLFHPVGVDDGDVPGRDNGILPCPLLVHTFRVGIMRVFSLFSALFFFFIRIHFPVKLHLPPARRFDVYGKGAVRPIKKASPQAHCRNLREAFLHDCRF